MSSRQMTAYLGETFAIRPQTSALRVDATPGAGVQVVFEIRGTTQARFSDDTRTVSVTTDRRGIATAPVINAGQLAGRFTIRASVAEHPDVDTSFTAAITARTADQLTHVEGSPLEATVGELLNGPVTVAATHRGAPLEGVALTATVLDGAGEPAADCPYFIDAAGEPQRTLTLAPTGRDGTVTLADLFAGDTAGAFLVRLTAPGGVLLDLPLTIHPAPAD
ncbi:hypothetical protein H9Y04_45290 [Streptomyces sp. TRM66268-LWL]|uniref:Uncharacterized protein n=1 Tax=Streptomyces polyasparticus TaxID=2767826 RepID=A0ABR7SYE2_9ACTN|nr:hypothetical protein [Streptomyces polyasparticus]MBC9719695.1 hypothetical protein [Streptomyces polyasparticus]